MAVQPRLSGTWSKTPKTGFLRTRLISSLMQVENLDTQKVVSVTLIKPDDFMVRLMQKVLQIGVGLEILQNPF